MIYKIHLKCIKGMVDFENRKNRENIEFLFFIFQYSMIISDQYATHRVPYAEMLKSICI